MIMPSLRDYINELTAKNLAHPLQPLLDIAAKKQKDADVARQFSEKVALLKEQGAITASTQRDRLRATSFTASRLPSPTSPGPRYRALPPNWVMPNSNVTRVRRLGFSKIIASDFPSSARL